MTKRLQGKEWGNTANTRIAVFGLHPDHDATSLHVPQ